MPTIANNIEQNRSIDGLSLVIALWCKICASATEQATAITILDAQKQVLADKANLALNDSSAFIGMQEVFGNVGHNECFQQAFEKWLDTIGTIGTNGIEKTLSIYVDAE